MKRDDFISLILTNIAIGEVFQNPGGGTSTIKRFDNEKIVYQRGNSDITLKMEKIYNAYEAFQGNFVTTNDLKKFDNSFDSTARNPSGHSCNCTFSFLLLAKAGLAKEIIKHGRVFGTTFI